jgi:hypothetical protein
MEAAKAPFEKKQLLSKDRTFLGQKINIGYRNGLALNNLGFQWNGSTYSLASAPSWSAEMIQARTEAIVRLLINANRLPGESVPQNDNMPQEVAP